MKQASPIVVFFVLYLLGALAAIIAGKGVLGVVFAAAGIGCCGCIRQNAVLASRPPRPVIKYLPQPVPHKPIIRLQRGQFVTLPWPHTLQVLLPEDTRLKILDSTPDRVRVMAV